MMYIIKRIVLLTCFLMHNSHPFTSLSDLQKYAKNNEEHPKSDNENWLDPDYTTHHQQIKETLPLRLLHMLGLYSKKTWTPQRFKKLLEEVTTTREQKKMSGDKVAKLTFDHEEKIYIWGDVHGAFHSLTRSLTWLEKQKIITQELKIVKPNTYFVFNGDFINRSPYILESLTLMLLLIKRNPNNIIYIRGKHENDKYWKNFGLKRELKIRTVELGVKLKFPIIIKEDIPLSNEIHRFFETLPHALYINTTTDPQNVIRISHVGRKAININEKLMEDFFSKNPKNKLMFYDLNKRKKTEKPITLTAIIKTENWMYEHQFSKGLGQLEQDKGTTAWAILSSPTMIYQKYYNFIYDAFAILNIKLPITRSCITLVNRNIKTDEPFKSSICYNVETGLSVADTKKIKKKPFVIGSTLSLIGGVPILGQRVKRGMNVRVKQENIKGGINGQQIKTIFINDDYIPHKARRNINNLKEEYNTDIILAPTGSPTLNAYLDLIKANKVLTLFPITGGPLFRDENLVGLVHLRATYGQEVVGLINYIIDKYAVQKFAFFYQDDAYGIGPFEVAKKILKEKGITSWIGVPYARASTDFKEQVEKIKAFQPIAIGLFSAALQTKSFLRQLGIQNLSNKHLFGLSFLATPPMRQFAQRYGLNIIFGAVVPNPDTSQLEIAKEYRKAMDKFKYPYDVFSFEGYIAMSILIDVMHKIEPPITKDKILKKLESLHNYNFKGLILNYNPKERTLARYIWIEDHTRKKWIKKPIYSDQKKEIPTDSDQPKKD